jgi:hypothetical protein
VALSDGSVHNIQDPHGLLIVGADCVTNNDYCVPVVIDTHPEPLGGIGASYQPHEASDAPLNLGETYWVENNSISIEVVNVVEGEYIDVYIDFNALSLSGDSSINKVNIYPNPTSDFINIDFDDNISFSVKLYDIYGKLLSSYTRTNQINMGNLSEGIYLLEIKDLTSNQKRTDKIIVTN